MLTTLPCVWNGKCVCAYVCVSVCLLTCLCTIILGYNYVCWCTMPLISVTVCLCFIACYLVIFMFPEWVNFVLISSSLPNATSMIQLHGVTALYKYTNKLINKKSFILWASTGFYFCVRGTAPRGWPWVNGGFRRRKTPYGEMCCKNNVLSLL